MQHYSGALDPQGLAISAQNPSQPRIAYFITRSNGTLVPLIPADELPRSVHLQGLPRSLTPDQTYGMQSIGVLPYTRSTFKLENEMAMVCSTSQPTHIRAQSNSPTRQYLPPETVARQAMANTAGVAYETPYHPMHSRPMTPHELTTTHWRKTPTSAPEDETQAQIDAIIGTVPDEDKKQYCSYWIRTGECDYMQQGCRYKHEMPDAETLKAIGFRGTPRWWIEKNQKVRLGSVKPMSESRIKDMASWWPGQSSSSMLSKPPVKDHSSDAGSDTRSDSTEGREPTTSAKEKIATKTPPTGITPPQQDAPLEHGLISGDLIDFDSPLIPAPTPSLSPEIPATKGKERSAGKDTETTKNKSVLQAPVQVFVPAGESPEAHIAQARKRAERIQSSSSRKSRTTEAPALGRQIQSVQKSRQGSLMASKHAPPIASSSEEGGSKTLVRKRVPKRDHAVPIRKPASTAAKAELAEKTGTETRRST